MALYGNQSTTEGPDMVSETGGVVVRWVGYRTKSPKPGGGQCCQTKGRRP